MREDTWRRELKRSFDEIDRRCFDRNLINTTIETNKMLIRRWLTNQI